MELNFITDKRYKMYLHFWFQIIVGKYIHFIQSCVYSLWETSETVEWTVWIIQTEL